MSTWVKVAIDAWTSAAGVVDGFVFRPVNRGDQVCGDRLIKLPDGATAADHVSVGGPPLGAPWAARANASRLASMSEAV
jgi:hypothetical protein